METITKTENRIRFHLGNPESNSKWQFGETCVFNERIQKIVVEADELEKDDLEEVDAPTVERTEEVVDVELEEEREQIRKMEEARPEEAKNQK